MRKHAITLLSALALITSTAFAAEAKAAKDCSDCASCCGGCCAQETASADTKSQCQPDGAKKTIVVAQVSGKEKAKT